MRYRERKIVSLRRIEETDGQQDRARGALPVPGFYRILESDGGRSAYAATRQGALAAHRLRRDAAYCHERGRHCPCGPRIGGSGRTGRTRRRPQCVEPVRPTIFWPERSTNGRIVIRASATSPCRMP